MCLGGSDVEADDRMGACLPPTPARPFHLCAGVGKSCLLLRFSEDSFTSSFITTIG